MTVVDLRDLGVDDAHQSTQEALDVLSTRLDAATDALLIARTEETLATWCGAWTAYDEARKAFTDAAYETAYGPDPIDLHDEARGWLRECFPHDDFDDATDEALELAVEQEYAGGWAAFVVSTRGAS